MRVGNIGRIGAFFIACALAFPAAAAILYTNANETPLNTGASNPVDSGTIKRLDDSCVLQDPQSYTHSDTQHVRRVTAPVRAGTYAQVQIVQKGCDYRSSNPDLRQKPRVGMVPKKTVIDAHSTTAGKRERWVSFSFYLSTDFQFETNTLNPDNLFQNFKEGSRSYGASNFDVTLKGTTLELQARNASANGQTGDTHVITGITRGQWYDITLHYNLQEPGGSGGFFAWYINYPGYATPSTPIFSNSDVGTTVNTETGAGQHSYAINLYKYAGYCTSAYQLNAVQCPYSTATGYPAATTNATNWTGQRKIYFDEFRIGDSTSSLAEIAPHVYGGGGPVDPPPTGVQIIGMNAGQPIEPSDDPVYFTATGGSVVGCLQVDITDQIGTKVTMPKCNTNATGGRYTADALTTLIGGPITVDLLYDVPLFDTATMTNTMDTWSGTNTATAATHTNGSLVLDYGYTTGVKITNSGTAGVIAPATGDRVTIANGATATARFVFSPDTDTQVKAQVQNSSGTVEYSGTLGSLALTQSTTGTGHSVTEWSDDGFYYIDIEFTSNNAATPATYRLAAGAKNNGPNKSIIWWDGKLWENQNPATVSFVTTLDKPDTTAPSPSDCQISASTASVMSLGCDLDDSTGTFYAVISTSATAPSLAQVKAGQDHTGAAALWSSSKSAATGGTFTADAINPYVQKCGFFAQTDGGANDSTVKASENCVAAGAEPLIKKFVWSEAAGNAIYCYTTVDDPETVGVNEANTLAPFTGDMAITITDGDWFAVGDDVNELAYAPAVEFTDGEAVMLESDLTFGSINALLTGAQGYNYWATDGVSCRSDNAIQLTAE